jgi:digeranylgeranylglycerophospholipid reductase
MVFTNFPCIRQGYDLFIKESDMVYDIAIIGAGPAGLMAAKVAAELGLKTVVLEKRTDVGRITRACCEQLIMDKDFQGDTVRLEAGSIVSQNTGFCVDYGGPAVDVTDKYFISPSGRIIHFAYPDGSPIVIKIDKGLMLRKLWDSAAASGAELRSGAHVTGAVDRQNMVALFITCGREQNVLNARKLIIADGVNSRTAEHMGINSNRQCFASALCVIYYLKNVTGFERSALKTYFGRAYCGLAPLTLNSALDDNDTACLVVIGNKNRPPEKMFHEITQKGALSPALWNARVVRKTGCAARAYTSLKVPHAGNVLVIGDAAAYVEVEMQGALACGLRAARAVVDELGGRDGFGQYTAWWQKAFEFNGDDYLQVAQGFALVPTYTDEELDYLFGLIEGEVLEGTYNQYKSPRLMWNAILKYEHQILSERPELHAKINSRAKATLSDML